MIGVTRVSLGVQDFDPDVQKAIGRIQPYAQVLRACFDLREAGIQKINLDLMYGLPNQTLESMEDTATLAASLKPDRISLFSYAHVPEVKKHQQALEKYGLLSPEESLRLEQMARQTLLEAGYVAVGMDHFALPHDSLVSALQEGTLRRTFQGYTDDKARTLLGVGASSIGFAGDTYFQNARDVNDYRTCVRQNGLAVMREFQRTEEDEFRGALIEKLMCQMEVDVEAVCAEYGVPLAAVYQNLLALAPFEMAGVIDRKGYKIKLAIPHRMAIRMIASLFDAYGQGEGMPVSRIM
jgi:oxygen-independent coproporphyrinogen-3 oxidase